eukprot:51907-Pyramimonas_sp.AAC.1
MSGLEASGSYGFSVAGCAVGELDKLRSLVFAAAAPSVAGRSRTLALMMMRFFDPIYGATVLPATAMLRAAWES